MTAPQVGARYSRRRDGATVQVVHIDSGDGAVQLWRHSTGRLWWTTPAAIERGYTLHTPAPRDEEP